MSLPTVQFRSPGVNGEVLVDGIKMPGLTAARIEAVANEVTKVMLVLSAQADIQIDGASITIEGVEMPESIELALLTHLARKYPFTAAVERSNTGLFALRGK